MIRSFLKERMSWIAFFLFSQLLMIGMALLDPTIPLASVLYAVFLSCVCFVLFFSFRYVKETAFYAELNERDSEWGLPSDLPEADSLFETIVAERLAEQLDHCNAELNLLQTAVEQEKDDMLNWIHEVKTPLTTMQLMIERVSDPSLRQQLTYEWLRVHLLLDQQLHQKRIPFLHNDLFIEKTDLQTVLFQEIKSLKGWCMQKGIGFDIAMEADEVMTDSKWLGFIIRQLLTNAVKYSEASDIAIHSTMNEGIAKLVIADRGRGIEEKDLQRIFDKGFTGTTYYRESAATGMGLYLVKQAAEALKLSINVRSEAGKGTEFTIMFPKKNDFVHLASM